MIQFPTLRADARSKTACLASLRVGQAVYDFIAAARQRLARPGAVDPTHLSAEGLRTLRKQAGGQLRGEFAAKIRPLIEAARAEAQQVRAAVSAKVDGVFAKATELQRERAKVAVVALSSTPIDSPERQAFYVAVRAGDEAALLAALLAPAGGSLSEAEKIARQTIAARSSETLTGGGDPVPIGEAQRMADAALALVELQTSMLDATLARAEATGKDVLGEDIGAAGSSGDLMLAGSRSAPIFAAAEAAGLIERPGTAERAAARAAGQQAAADRLQAGAPVSAR